MRSATITVAITPNVPMPPSVEIPFGAFAGFRLTLVKTSTKGQVVYPIQVETVWNIGQFQEGESYDILVESVDIEGRPINRQDLTVLVPTAGAPVAMYSRVDAISVIWDDAQAALL